MQKPGNEYGSALTPLTSSEPGRFAGPVATMRVPRLITSDWRSVHRDQFDRMQKLYVPRNDLVDQIVLA
jgi:hypothetical protein